MSDFVVTCSTCFNIWSAGSIAQLLNTVGDKISKYVHQTLICTQITNSVTIE